MTSSGRYSVFFLSMIVRTISLHNPQPFVQIIACFVLLGCLRVNVPVLAPSVLLCIPEGPVLYSVRSLMPLYFPVAQE